MVGKIEQRVTELPILNKVFEAAMDPYNIAKQGSLLVNNSMVWCLFVWIGLDIKSAGISDSFIASCHIDFALYNLV